MSTTAQNEPAQSLILFARGVIAILTGWPVMRIALEQGWGDADQRTMLASEVVDAFESPKKPDQDEIEEILLQAMAEEFNCEVEDGSERVVSRHVLQLWKDVATDRAVKAVEALEETAGRLAGTKVQAKMEVSEADSESDDDEDDDEGEGAERMDVDDHPPTLVPASKVSAPPEVDEDGFTVVKPKGRR